MLSLYLVKLKVQTITQWRRNGSGGSMKRGSRAPGGPRVVGPQKSLGKTLRKIIKIVATK